MNSRLQLALSRISDSEAQAFESFAIKFLQAEFLGFGNHASLGGRSEVFVESIIPRTAFQISVAADWPAEVARAVEQIGRKHSGVRRLIYCTNRAVGATFDQQRESIWSSDGVQVDMRDRDWFIQRASDGPVRATATAELIEQVIKPELATGRIAQSVAGGISREDARIALLQLALNDKDSRTDRSLTKTCFDSLVRAALIGTSAEQTLSRAEVQAAVRAFLPNANSVQMDALTVSALTRLAGKNGAVKHIRSVDRYHLSFTESQAWQDGAADYLLDQAEMERDLAAAASMVDQALDSDLGELWAEGKRLRVALESLWMRRGEVFAHALTTEPTGILSIEEIAGAIATLDQRPRLAPERAAEAILMVLAAPSDRTREHLSRLLDAYTLFAFLQQTPDVQKALSHMFSGGQLWLDTSAVLPLLAESVEDETHPRPFTDLLTAASGSGVELYVTSGVVEEINHHLNNCTRFMQIGSGAWRGRVPYVYAAYMLSGRSEAELASWVADIKGAVHPEVDIAEYLEYTFKIKLRGLQEEALEADAALRGAVQNVWLESHARRRGEKGLAIGSLERLIKHDVENAVGVIQVRKSTAPSQFGHSAWWLTLDRTAFSLGSSLRAQLGPEAPDSPVLSPDFLSQMLRFGPLRREPAAMQVSALPVSAEVRKFENVPAELVELAKTTREQFAGYNETRVRREVRDALHLSRTATKVTGDGLATIEEELLELDAPTG